MSARRLFPAALALALSGAAALGGGCGPSAHPDNPSSSGSSSSSSGSGTGGHEPPPAPQHSWTECQASDQAWVRRALFALDGRHARSQAEVNAWEDAIKGLRQADLAAAGPSSDAGAPAGADLENARKLVARAMMAEDAFRERWSDFFLEVLHVNRIEIKSQEACYGAPLPTPFDSGALAAFVRDHDSGAGAPPLPGFTMGQLLSSALALDDLSVLYRTNLFAMMHLPITGANVDFTAMERIRRRDFGAVFSSAYLHRDLVCLSCHNSEFSVTFDQDPAKNRAWPVAGLFEQSLYGASNGQHPPAEAAIKGPDDLRALSMLRYADVVDDNGKRPWGWAVQCGAFTSPQQDDPLSIDAYFGSVQGVRASVWDLERALHRGVDLLGAHGLRRGKGGALADPDEALAYLVAETIVEDVWNEAVGHRLTIANYFPRTEVQRDILMGLTEHFIASHFSLKTLLLDVLAHPAFNLKAPDEGCGVAPYELPNVFDPWTVSDNDLSRRGNSPADGVFAVSSRPLLRSLHHAMLWPAATEYPHDDQTEAFEVAIGFFIKDGEPGFRGLDFQGRLTWETTYGACTDLSFGQDFIAHLVTQAKATPGATLGDAVIALKDRLLGEPSIDAAEQTDLEMLLGAPLTGVDFSNLDAKLRAACGVFVSTPQALLGGIPPRDTRTVPTLTPPEAAYDVTCTELTKYLMGASAPYTVTCGGTTKITRP